MAHIRKKQISSAQPSITFFFDRTCTSQRQDGQQTTPTLRPNLPQNIQSSLLNVGMRVRKSVPEGYKTHKTLGLDDYVLPATQTPAPVRAAPAAAAPPSSAPPVLLRSDSSRELMPFCGLHTVGGMSQTTPGPSAVPSLVSQASAASGYSPVRSGDGLKRSYSEEMEAELDDEYEFENGNGLGDVKQRMFAQPTARLKPGHGYGDVGVVIAGDFHDEDVDFLQ